jgi:hypothetical protein
MAPDRALHWDPRGGFASRIESVTTTSDPDQCGARTSSIEKDNPMISFATTRTDLSPSSGENATPLGVSAGEIAAEARRRLAEAEAILKTVVTNRPLLAVGAALAAGVILGWLIKRR